MTGLLFRKEKIRTMEQTAAYERLKAVIPIHPADSTKYRDYFPVFHLFANPNQNQIDKILKLLKCL